MNGANRVERMIIWLRHNAVKIEGIKVGSVSFNFAHHKVKPDLKESHECLPIEDIVDKPAKT